jgi:hypothetical protein
LLGVSLNYIIKLGNPLGGLVTPNKGGDAMHYVTYDTLFVIGTFVLALIALLNSRRK